MDIEKLIPRVDIRFQPLLMLPNFTARIPVPETSTEKGLAIIPVFKTWFSRKENVHAYIRGAMYARASCLKYTDAMAENVAVKLYIEDSLRDMLMPILMENCIDEEDILFFTAPPLKRSKDGQWGALTKKMCSFSDPQLATYDWVVGFDADALFHSETDFSFKSVFAHPKEIGYIRVRREPYQQMQSKWKTCLGRDTTPLQMSPTLILGEVMFNGFRAESLVQYPVGYLWAYPARYFHENYPDLIWWLSEKAGYLGNDEVCVSVIAELFDLNIFSMEDDLGYRSKKIHNFYRGHATLLHGIPETTEAQTHYMRLSHV